MTVKTKKGNGRNYWKIALLLCGFIAALAVLTVAAWFTVRLLFTGNERFSIRNVEVNSSGWWNGKGKLAARMLGIEVDKDNLFQFDLNRLRNKMEKISSVESAVMLRKLPDTLVINVIERIPRAFLSNNRSDWVVDSSGVVMSRFNCVNLNKDLPIVLGFELPRNIRAGIDLPELIPALELIMNTIRDFPEFRITAISVRDPDRLTFFLIYKGDEQTPYKVFIPRRELKYMLIVLRSAIIKAKELGDMRTTIDLTYRGTAILR